MQDQFLKMIDRRSVMIGCNNASREDVNYILKNHGKHNFFEVSLGFVDSKNRGADGKYGIANIGKKVGYKMNCKNKEWVGKVFGDSAVRFVLWQRMVRLTLDKMGYAMIDLTIMMDG